MTHNNGPWTILASTEKHRDSFLSVHEDQVIRPDGERGTYTTVAMKPGVAVLPVDDQGRVYLTSQFRYVLEGESVEVVCGGIDEGEEPLVAAKRELREELSIEAVEWFDLGYFDLDTSMVGSKVNLFVARALSFSEADQDGTETIEGMKVPFEDAVAMVMGGAITHGPSCVLILKARLATNG
jgi:8-oxo-dGTP pyrophosphatase MutT (NUDIX family)